MYAGQFALLIEVLQHYNQAPEAPAGHSELHALNLTPQELEQLAAFLGSLSGPLTAPAESMALESANRD
jgi:cytochrome c peroxidase